MKLHRDDDGKAVIEVDEAEARKLIDDLNHVGWSHLTSAGERLYNLLEAFVHPARDITVAPW